MTVKFLNSVEPTLKHEGGYNDIKHDKGGATNWGISLRFLQSINEDVNKDGIVDFKDIKNLNRSQAIELYYENFWKPIYDKLPQLVAMKVFDVSVNAGSSRSHILLQRALNKLGANIKVDGLLGSGTLSAVSKYSEQSIVNAICVAQQEFYEGLVDKDPTQSKFAAGWKNRARYLLKA